MSELKLSFFIILSVIKLCSSNDSPLVTTTLGEIKGHYLTSSKNVKYEAYEGIPYALPPQGDKRFRPPEPVLPWKDLLLADKIKEDCCEVRRSKISSIFNISRYQGVEDCLYLNVYVPEKKSSELFPVMVFFYGGGFQFSGLKGTEQNNFMDKNVIFVGFNYRHGAFGFLSTEDDVVSGNMGLKDQVMALKWIKDHIKSFGGDPDRVTLTGISAGGASIHYHYLSPMSKGLFTNGISMSGTALMPWAQAKNSKEKALKLAELLECNTTDVPEMVECLRSKPAQSLMQAQINFTGWREVQFSPFGPVVEKNTKNPFIDRPPVEIINSGDAQNLTWIASHVSEEGIFPVAEFCTNEGAMKELDENWESLAPELLQYQDTVPKSNHSKVARAARKFYLGEKPINKENLLGLLHMVGDRVFGFDSVKAAKLQARATNSSVYYYYYTYRAAESGSEIFSGSKENFGTSHADDKKLFFRALGNSDKEKVDLVLQEKLIEFWVSVAHGGEPSSGLKWTKLNGHSDDFEYLEVAGPDQLAMKKNSSLANGQFWESIEFDENNIVQNSVK